MANYPDVEGHAYTFAGAELSLGRRIFTAISNVEVSQPTERGVVKGTRSYVLKVTQGTMDLGEGTITFSDEAERAEFINQLGDNWRETKFEITWTLTAKGAPTQKYACFGCFVNDESISHEEGADALGGDVEFCFVYKTINGKVPHSGLPAPTNV